MQVFNLRSKPVRFSYGCSLRYHVTQICLTYWLMPSWIINEFENTRSKDRFYKLLFTFDIDKNKLIWKFIWKNVNLQWEHSLRKQASTKNKPIYRSLLSMHLTFFLFFYLLFWNSSFSAHAVLLGWLFHTELSNKILIIIIIINMTIITIIIIINRVYTVS